MKRILAAASALMLGCALPLAASAHTDVSIGVNLGVPVYDVYDRGYYEPAPVYYPAPRVYYEPRYIRDPVVIYYGDYGYRDWDRREWRHHGHGYGHWKHHGRDDGDGDDD